MKLIAKKIWLPDFIEHFHRRYDVFHESTSPNDVLASVEIKEAIMRLQKLNMKTCSYPEVVAATGKWSNGLLPYCDECGQMSDMLIQFLEENADAQEANDAKLCPSCLSKGIALLSTEGGASSDTKGGADQ
jgi:hypothetical protein